MTEGVASPVEDKYPWERGVFLLSTLQLCPITGCDLELDNVLNIFLYSAPVQASLVTVGHRAGPPDQVV